MNVLPTERLYQAHRLASTLCNVLGRGAFVSIAQLGEQSSHATIGGWAGPVPTQPSSAPFVANVKLAELLLMGAQRQLTMTPVKGFSMGLGWKGGIRDRNLIVGVSKWTEDHDLLLAAIVMYSLKSDVRLHHIGVQYETEALMRAASEEMGLVPIEIPADDHQRIYHYVPDLESHYGGHYSEVQYFPNEAFTPRTHWDVVTADPRALLKSIGDAVGVRPEFWTAGENDPSGVVWVPSANDGTLGIMARSKFWHVKA